MNRNDKLIEYVAELYYDRGLSQTEIASIINASRPTVSRLIEDARKQGVVKIIIETSVSKNNRLSNKLRRTFHLRDAIVVSAAFDFDKSIDVCGKALAALLPVYLQSGMTVGVSWGRAINSVINAMDRYEYDGVNVAQMVGCTTMGDPSVDGFSTAQRLAYRLHGTYTSISAPLFVEGEDVYHYLINEPLISNSLNKAMKVDMAINGIGSLDDRGNSIRRSGYYDYYGLERYTGKGAVASFQGRFLDIEGKEVTIDGIYAISTPLEILKQIPLSFVLNATAEKAEPTLAVLNGGYADILVVDEPLALRLLELAKK